MLENEVELLLAEGSLCLFCREFVAEDVEHVLYRYFKVLGNIRNFIFYIIDHLCYSSHSSCCMHAVKQLFEFFCEAAVTNRKHTRTFSNGKTNFVHIKGQRP